LTTSSGTQISIGTDSLLKPLSCGEIIHQEENLGYGYYSLDIIASPVVGQVTGFFLIASKDPAQSEIDIELTGLNNGLAWMNVWHDHDSKPTSIPVPFDTSKDWHNYMMEWRKDYIAWSIDGKVVLNRTDIVTTPPSKTNYKLAINSWAQIQPETKLAWAGKFKHSSAEVKEMGKNKAPVAQFRNLKFRPAPATQFQRSAITATENRAVSNALDMSSIAFEDDGEDVNDGSTVKSAVAPSPQKVLRPGATVGEGATTKKNKPVKKPVKFVPGSEPLPIEHKPKHHQKPSGPKRLQNYFVSGVDGVEGVGIAQQWF